MYKFGDLKRELEKDVDDWADDESTVRVPALANRPVMAVPYDPDTNITRVGFWQRLRWRLGL